MKRLLTLFAIAAVFVLTAAVASADSSTVTVSGGSLAESIANVPLTGVTLDGTDKTTTNTSSNSWTAEDPTGTGAGWHLTITSTDFTSEDVQEVYNTGDTTDTFTLTYGTGGTPTTGDIDWDASAADIDAALILLTDITAVTVTGSGTSSSPWVIRFDTVAVSDTLVAVDTGEGMTSTITLATIDISEDDQRFTIEMQIGDIGVTYGNTQPTSSVTTAANITDSAVTFLSAAVDTGMGSYTLDPDFELEVRAEVYAAAYTATITVTIVTAP